MNGDGRKTFTPGDSGLVHQDEPIQFRRIPMNWGTLWVTINIQRSLIGGQICPKAAKRMSVCPQLRRNLSTVFDSALRHAALQRVGRASHILQIISMRF
jgi:hypothetical protein